MLKFSRIPTDKVLNQKGTDMSVLSRSRWNEMSYKKSLNGKQALVAVKDDGFNLVYVADQTEALCLIAVTENPAALMFVKDQTEAVVMAALKGNGLILRLVRNQTKAICQAAVESSDQALMYVEERFLDNDGSLDGSTTEINGKTYKLMEI